VGPVAEPPQPPDEVAFFVRQVLRHEPCSPPPSRGIPLPAILNVFPAGVPAGTFKATLPVIVGTSASPPSMASVNGTSMSV